MSDAPRPPEGPVGQHDQADQPEQPAEPDPSTTQAARHHPVYDALSESQEFQQLRKKYRGFVIPATIGFLAWYLLYVVLSNWAPGFMGTTLFGNINVALVFGLLQFLTTFALAFVYARYSRTHMDPLARGLEERFRAEGGTR